MTSVTNTPSLTSLEYIPYIDSQGQLPDSLQTKVGVYAIFDQEKILQFIGYSRDVYISLKQHLVRQPQYCYWLKVQTIDRPSRTLLEEIRDAWIAENGSIPAGNGCDQTQWNHAIDVKALMTAEEQAAYNNPKLDEMGQVKLLKTIARRVEGDRLALLKERGVQVEIRFNPKLKEEGWLDLK